MVESMEQVFKYPLDAVADRQTIWMPGGAEILCVQVQAGSICIWARVSNLMLHLPQPRHFRVVGAGHDFDGSPKYIGTVQMDGGNLVLHVFEEI